MNFQDGRGRLPPCPPTPNCVSTEECAPDQAMAPIPFTGSAAGVQAAVRRALLAEARTRIVLEEPGYLRAEARSRIFRFVDDVEMVIDADERVIRFRSASRIGRRDFGVNRARMRRIGARLISDPALER